MIYVARHQHNPVSRGRSNLRGERTESDTPVASEFGDIDKDGFLDCYIGTGHPQMRALLPNRMFRNDGDFFFQDVPTSGGFGHLQKGSFPQVEANQFLKIVEGAAKPIRLEKRRFAFR